MKPNFWGILGIAMGIVGFGLWICATIEGQSVDDKLRDWSLKLQRVSDDMASEEETLKAEAERIAKAREELDKKMEEYKLLIAGQES